MLVVVVVVVVVVVEFFNNTLSNAKQTMKMQADNTDTQNEHQCKQSTVRVVRITMTRRRRRTSGGGGSL